jgi:hypothetical protein
MVANAEVLEDMDADAMPDHPEETELTLLKYVDIMDAVHVSSV